VIVDVSERMDDDSVLRSSVLMDSGSSTTWSDTRLLVNTGSFCSVAGVVAGVVAVLLLPDIFRMISIDFFFTGPGGVLVGKAGNPEICLATVRRSLSFRLNGVFGVCGILTCPWTCKSTSTTH